METAGLIDLIFNLPYHFAVPDMLYHDELREQHSHLPALGLQTLSLAPETMLDVMRMTGQYKQPGRNDLFALALAKQENCPLLTGDKHLREAASKESVDLMGTIWLMGELVRYRVITVDRARSAYRDMKDSGRRLPWAIALKELTEIENDL